MKVIDKTPLQNEQGEIGPFQRLQGLLEYGLQWYPQLEGQKAVLAQLEQVLEKGFTVVRNVTLGSSKIVEPLVLVGPPGVYVIYVTPLTGVYEAKGDQWNQVKGGHAYQATPNLMTVVTRLARALQIYLERQGIKLPGPVEPVLIAASPAMHIDSLRPVVRVVLSDAVKQFAASLLQQRPVLRPEVVFDISERVVTPKPRPVPSTEPSDVKTPEYIPPGLRDNPDEEVPEARARAIFHAAEEAKPFDPADLDFAFNENAETEEAAVPEELKEPSPSQPVPAPAARGAKFSNRQWLLLGAMVLIECCVVGGFAYVIFSSAR